MSIVKILKDVYKYTLKGVGTPEYHLGGDIEWREFPVKVLTWGSRTYVKQCLENYKQKWNPCTIGTRRSPRA